MTWCAHNELIGLCFLVGRCIHPICIMCTIVTIQPNACRCFGNTQDHQGSPGLAVHLPDSTAAGVPQLQFCSGTSSYGLHLPADTACIAHWPILPYLCASLERLYLILRTALCSFCRHMGCRWLSHFQLAQEKHCKSQPGFCNVPTGFMLLDSRASTLQ